MERARKRHLLVAEHAHPGKDTLKRLFDGDHGRIVPRTSRDGRGNGR
jgi:hypothetical protein